MKIKNTILAIFFFMLSLFSLSSNALDSGGKIIIVPLSGFDSTVAASPVGGNYRTTVGAQRLEVFNHAAFLWSTILDLDYDIKVEVNFSPLTCSPSSATLGYAGPNRVKKINNVWYSTAQANQILKTDTSRTYNDIYADFNSSIDNGCYNGVPNGWYYGIDNVQPANQEALLDVVLHEIGHGLGFLSFVDGGTGALFNGYIDAYSKNLYDNDLSKNWTNMTNTERLYSNNHDVLTWDGVNGNASASEKGITTGLINGNIKMHAPLAFNSGSSVSHISTTVSPDQLMEPYNTPTGVSPSLETAMFKDIGYKLKSELTGNNIPVAESYSVNVPLNGSVTLNYLSHVTEYDADTVFFLKYTSQPSNGVIGDMYSGVTTYTPINDFTGTDTVNWVVYDSKMTISDEGTITFIVGDVNNAPVANNDSYSVISSIPSTLNVVENDTDSDGTLNSSSISLVTSPSHGSVSVSSGQFLYTGDNSYDGSDTFTYTVQDNDGSLSNPATVSIDVNPRDIRAISINDSFTFEVNSSNNSLSSVVNNDSDSDAITSIISRFSITSLPSNGTVYFVDSIPHYTPSTNFIGNDSFTYKISGEGYSPWDSAIATVAITVLDSNQTPVSNNDFVSTTEDTLTYINPLTNDTDDSSFNPALMTVTLQPSHGSMVRIGSTYNYTPDLNFNGNDSFSYTISDSLGKTSEVAFVSIAISAVNDNPVAVNDFITTGEGLSSSLNVLSNDSDVDGDTLAYSNINVSQPNNGSVSVNSSSITYTPNVNFSGNDHFTYSVSDGSLLSNVATVNVSVTPNIDPATTSSFSISTNEDTVFVNGLLSSNTVAGDRPISSYNLVSPPVNGVISISGNTFTFTPNRNFNGTDSFTYSATDSDGAVSNTSTVSITVTPINDHPVSNNDGLFTDEDVTSTIDVLSNDIDLDGDSLLYTNIIFSQPANGLVSINSNSLSYTPNTDFNGVDSFTYSISDGSLVSNLSTVSVTVNSVVDLSASSDFSVVTDEDIILLSESFSSHIVVGDAAISSYNLVSPPANGVVSISGDTFTFTPNRNFNGVDSFTYSATDSDGAVSNVSTVSITVTSINDAPVATNDSIVTDEDTSATINVLFNDIDFEGDSLVYANVTISQPANGFVSVNGDSLTYNPKPNFNGNDSFTYSVSDGILGSNSATVNVTVAPVVDLSVSLDFHVNTEEDTPIINESFVPHLVVGDSAIASYNIVDSTINGIVSITGSTFTFTPSDNFHGNDKFTYTSTSLDGAISNVATVSVTVNPVNDSPVAVADIFTVSRSATSIDILSNDSDVETDSSLLTITIETQPTNGVLSISGVNVLYLIDSESLSTTDSFSYYITDVDGIESDIVSVDINISSARPPITNIDVFNVVEDGNVSMPVTENDSGDQTLTSISVVGNPTYGTALIEGMNIVYTPNKNFSGQDSLSYVVVDHLGLRSTPANVTINVSEVNDAPITYDDFVTATHSRVTELKISLNDEDENMNSATVVIVSTPVNGEAIVNGRIIEYTSNSMFDYSTDTLTYKIVDSAGLSSNVSTVNISITHNTPSPVGNNDSYTVFENSSNSFKILDNDVFGTNSLSINIISDVKNGTLYVYSDSVLYEPTSPGVDSFVYTITDELGQTSGETSVDISIPMDIATSAFDDFVTINEDTMVVINVLFNDYVSHLESVSIISDPLKGLVTINNDNNIEYTPNLNEIGSDTFQYMITDIDGDTSIAKVSITIIDDKSDFFSVNNSFVVNEDSLNTALDVLFNDTKEGENYKVVLNTLSNHGLVTVDSLNRVLYTPNNNFNGNDNFTYSLLNLDTNIKSNISNVSIRVSSVNDTPVASPDSFQMKGGDYTELTVLNNDTDVDGDSFSLNVESLPGNGTLSINGDELFYEAAFNYNGTDSFSYSITDIHGATSLTVDVKIHVTEVQNSPANQNDDLNTVIDVSGEETGAGNICIIFTLMMLSLCFYRKKTS